MTFGLVLAALFGAMALLGGVGSVRRNRRRERAFERAGAELGLAPARCLPDLRERLAGLPALQAPGHPVLMRGLEAPDVILADWLVRRGPKQRPRPRPRTLVAFRFAGRDLAVRQVAEVDETPGGLGRVALESAGEWVACYCLDRRVPDAALVAFHGRARERLSSWVSVGG